MYDPVTGEWVKDSPWITNVHLDPNDTKTVLYYALLPDRAGTYTLQSEIGSMDGGTYTFDRYLKTDIAVSKDASGLCSDVISALSALNLSGRDRAKVQAAIRYLGYVQKRQAAGRNDVEANLDDMLKAIDSLIGVEGTYLTDERLLSDALLRMWEGRWYYFGLKR